MRTLLTLMLLASTWLLQGCLELDWIADGRFEPYNEVRLIGSNGVSYGFNYTSRSHLMFSSDRSVIRMGFPSGARIEVTTPSPEGLDPAEGFVPATGNSQNFDVLYKREIVCDYEKLRFHQRYIVTLLARGTEVPLGQFTGRGPNHPYPFEGNCPTP